MSQSENKSDPNCNIWQVQTTFKIAVAKNKELLIQKNSFLFLIGIENNFMIFKTEDGTVCKLHKSVLDLDKIKKVF